MTAASGAEDLAKIESEHPDLVLLDVMIPGMNGYEVCQNIRANPATGMLPMVVVTALDPAQERVKGIEAGADDFLSKPIIVPTGCKPPCLNASGFDYPSGSAFRPAQRKYSVNFPAKFLKTLDRRFEAAEVGLAGRTDSISNGISRTFDTGISPKFVE